MTLQLDQLDLDRLTMELGMHVRCRCPVFDVTTVTAKGWLDRTTWELPALGHWRYAAGRDGVELFCEFSRAIHWGGDPLANVRDVFWVCLDSLTRSADSDASSFGPPAAADDIETALQTTCILWSRRDASWTLKPAEAIALTVESVAGGVLVCGELAAWETLPDDVADALATFLNDAQSRIWGARCQWRGASVSATSFVSAQELERDFSISVQSVFDAVRRFGSSARALLAPSLARHFRSFCQSSPPHVGSASLDS